MTKNLRIKNGFDRLTDAYLLVRAGFIYGCVLNNPEFTSPGPALTELEEAINGFAAVLPLAVEGSRQHIAEKNSLRATLIAALHRLGNYVLFAAAGNEVMATSSGFIIAKSPATRPAINIPQDLVLKNGVNRGELELNFKRVLGASAYMHQITPSPVTPESKWESVLATVTKNLFTKLQSGTEYTCRVTAVAAKKQIVHSEMVSRIAL